MPRICEFTGKKTKSGNSRSHSMIASKRRFKPNLINVSLDIGGGVKVPVKVSAKAYKKMRGMV